MLLQHSSQPISLALLEEEEEEVEKDANGSQKMNEHDQRRGGQCRRGMAAGYEQREERLGWRPECVFARLM